MTVKELEVSVDAYIAKFWHHWAGEQPIEDAMQRALTRSLKDTFYSMGLVRVKALENLDGMVTKDRVYTVRLVKDKYFPEGEECVESDNGELLTLPCFKREVVF